MKGSCQSSKFPVISELFMLRMAQGGLGFVNPDQLPAGLEFWDRAESCGKGEKSDFP